MASSEALCEAASGLETRSDQSNPRSNTHVDTNRYTMDSTTWPTLSVRISLAANVAILVACCSVLIAFSTSETVEYCWGPPTPSRGILLSVYFAILVSSLLLLWLHVRCAEKSAIEHMVATLLVVQILYKITTPATAGASNPVAISNLAISVLHAATLLQLWRKHKVQLVGALRC